MPPGSILNSDRSDYYAEPQCRAAQPVFQRQRLRTRFRGGVIETIVATLTHVCKHGEYDLSPSGWQCLTTEAQRFRNSMTVAT